MASWYEQVSLFILLLHYKSFIAPLVIAQIYLVIITLQFLDSSPRYNKDYVPTTRRVGGYIVFGADPVGVHFFVSMHYLLNLSMDFDQTYIYTLLGGGGDEVTLTLSSRSQGHFEMSKIWFQCVIF